MEEEQQNPMEKAQLLAPIKPPLKSRVWFYLTCWRPVTKHELAQTIRALLSIDTKVRLTINQLNRLTIMFNQMIAFQEGKKEGEQCMHQQPVIQENQTAEEEEEDNPMYS